MAIQDFNQARAARATSERSFALGPFTFKRRIAVPPESLVGFRREVADAGDNDVAQLAAAERVIAAVCDPIVTNADGDEVTFEAAWHTMRFEGDEYGVLDVADLMAISRWLIEGVVERPTGQPSGSSDGSTTPATGTTSTGDSPSPAPALNLSTPDGVSMRSTPA